MAVVSPRRFLLLVSVIFLSSTPSHSLTFSNIRTLLSLSHSLASRVAALRTARGDAEGAARAIALRDHLERGMSLKFYKFALNLGWDYVKNYAWRDTASFSSMGEAMVDLKELLELLNDFNRCNSERQRAAWAARNYRNAVRVSKSLLSRLLEVFSRSGALREVVIALQKEVVDGDLVRDCLELGAGDLKALIQVLAGIARQYASSGNSRAEL